MSVDENAMDEGLEEYSQTSQNHLQKKAHSVVETELAYFSPRALLSVFVQKRVKRKAIYESGKEDRNSEDEVEFA